MFEDGGRSTILLSLGTALSQEQRDECTRLQNGKEYPFVIIILLVSSLLGGMKGLTDESMGETGAQARCPPRGSPVCFRN